MKLVAKAKPVKIRIKSGGEEHSSLDSLKMNFCIDDVRELLDGRLSRWLRQQNEILLAEEIDKFENQNLNSDDKCLEFIRLLFKEDLGSVKIASLFDLAKHWCFNDVKYKFNGEAIFNRIINTDVEAAKYAYKNNYTMILVIFSNIFHHSCKYFSRVINLRFWTSVSSSHWSFYYLCFRHYCSPPCWSKSPLPPVCDSNTSL